ncbi:MAG: hypothetical protein IT376_00430 [Polyangiaceae bacterium]|nr:hypothetical protein [Polyangiaceae bacterium]
MTFLLETATVAFSGTGAQGTGSAPVGYTVICIAPCEATLSAETHRLALSTGGGRPVEVEQPITLRGPATLHVNSESRSRTRTVGGLLLAISRLGGPTLAVVGAKRESGTDVPWVAAASPSVWEARSPARSCRSRAAGRGRGPSRR